jgi:hypothetical protein
MAAVGLLAIWTIIILVFGRSIDGTVTDIKTGKPIPFAFVRIGNITTQADNQGNFHRWTFATGSTDLIVEHPAFLPLAKPFGKIDFSKSVKFELTQAGYEEMKTNATIHLKQLNSMITRMAYDDFIKDEKSGLRFINRTENIMAYTRDAVMYIVGGSRSNSDDLYYEKAIITDSDPGNPGSIVLVKGRKPPRVYVKSDTGQDWVTFSVFDRPDYELPLDTKNPKELLSPLEAYGNTSEFDLFETEQKTRDGSDLIGCTLKWPKDSILRGKSVTYYFRKSSGNWYSIEFFDTGENPASKPGRYYFQLLDERPGLVIQIPQDAKPYKENVGE